MKRFCVKVRSCPMGRKPIWERWNEFESFDTKAEAEIALAAAEEEVERTGFCSKLKIGTCKGGN